MSDKITYVPKSKVVMVVDDAPEIIEILNAVIREAGYRFIAARSGKRCLELLPEIQPDLILLDIQMPDWDGFETCRQIRATREGKHVPVVFLTVRKTATDVREAMSAGANDFLMKPFDAKSLLARIGRWLKKAA